MSEYHLIKEETIERVLSVLRNHMFWAEDGDEGNNEDVIAAIELLESEIEPKDNES